MAAFTRSQNEAGNNTRSDFDVLMFTSEMMGELGSTGALMDLQPFIKDDAKQVVNWNDLQPYQSSVSSMYKQQVLGIPVVENPFIMYVNWPLLTSAYNISGPTLTQPGRLSFYPDTWQELISVMQRVNATASDPATGLPRHALCLPLQISITYLLQAVMASIMQTQGYTQGFLYDPLTLEPLTNNTAMQQALRITRELYPFIRTFDLADVVDMSQCAIALAGTDVFKSLSQSRSNRLFIGQLSMSPLPASTEVLDRSTMQLVPCTQELCNSQRATQLGGQLANLSPSRFKEAFFLGMSSQVPEQLRSATYNLIAFIGSPGVMKQVLQLPIVPAAPFRTSGLLAFQAGEDALQSGGISASTTQDPMQQPGLNAWRSQGYNYSDVLAYNGALLRSLYVPSTAMDIRVAWQQDPQSIIRTALTGLLVRPNNQVRRCCHVRLLCNQLLPLLQNSRNMSGKWVSKKASPPGSNPAAAHPGMQVSGGAGSPSNDTTAAIAAVMDAMTIGLRLVRDSVAGGADAFREQLWGTTGFVPPALPPPPSPPSPPVLPGAPGLSKRDTSIEVLPAAVVEASMKLHDNLIRRLAQDHAGYEFGTEGDSFLLCFHTPAAAVRFATQLQEALLLCTTWPAELQVAGSPGQPLHLASVHTGTSQSSSGTGPQHSRISLASAATTWNGHDRASPSSYRASALLSRTAKSLKVLRLGQHAEGRSRVSSQSRVDLAQQYSGYSGEGSAFQPASRSGNGAAAVVPEQPLQQRLNPVFSAGLNHHSTSSATSARQVQPTASHPSAQSINIELVQPQQQHPSLGRSIAFHAVEGLLGLFALQLTAQPAGPPDGKLSTVVSSNRSIPPNQDQVGSSSGAATTSQLDLSTASHSALDQGRVGWQRLCALYRE
ncbi:uncharacterized protein HaLaN_10988, partial [Haematococcus lacustris]